MSPRVGNHRAREKQTGRPPVRGEDAYVRWFDDLGADDVPEVGGKNASLGEMVSALKDSGIRVPGGFATTARAYHRFLSANEIGKDLQALIVAFQEGKKSLESAGETIRELFLGGEFPEDVARKIVEYYRELSRRYDTESADVAVRSSATAEDLPEASFAGQLESFLNVSGEDELLEACKKCFASLFTNRAIAYREERGFDHLDMALSVGVQKMVRSDKACAGVLFTLDTDSGFPDVVMINAAWGLGDNVVQGTVNPDEHIVFKPFLGRKNIDPIIGKQLGSKELKKVYAAGRGEPTKDVKTTEEERHSFALSEEEVTRLAQWGAAIESHYERPMDIEWAKDGDTGELFIVQARPETVQSREDNSRLKTYRIRERGTSLVTGLGIGQGVAAGAVSVIESASEIDRFPDGAVLVTTMTDPDWVPIMKRAAAIVTDRGGRTSHAAIVSRELGLPAIVGTGNATETLQQGQEVTVSCAEGEAGHVYEGILDVIEEEVDLADLPRTKTRIMMNIASPQGAMRWWRLPVNGVGLARMEYVINNVIKIHPLALTRFDEVEDKKARGEIERLTRGFEEMTTYFVEHLARGIATIAAAQYPDPVHVRMSDFKTNEYADLVGGSQFEPDEENPMLGWRGASRYYDDDYADGFALECRAIRRARDQMGFDNVVVMIPFCRTPDEADRVLEVLAENGLKRGERGLQVYVMAELPSNVLEAEEFAERFDGFSIGSNDLTQLALGVDRDAAKLAPLFDESSPSVKRLVAMLIEEAHKAGKPVSICGEAPSNDPDFAAFLVQSGIDSISLSPDSVVGVIRAVAKIERDG